MKKISAVLLVMVLVGSVAFAGFTGEASVSFGADLDSLNYGIKNATELSADITIFELLVDKAGEGDIHAEINANLTFGFEFDEQAGTIGDNDYDFSGDLDYTAEITSAKIRGDNWYVGILGAMAAPNFAESAIDKDKTAGKKYLDLNPADFVGKNAGVEVMYADYVFGLSIDDGLNKIDGSIYNIFGSVKTPTYEFADGLTVAFGAAGLLANTGKAASGSAEVAYVTDDYSASLATDIIYDSGFMVEVAAAAAFAPFGVDLYFASHDDAGTPAYTATTNILSVKASAKDLEGFDVTVTGKDLINSQALSAEVAYAVTDEVKVGVNGGYTIDDKSWSVGGEVTYTVDMFTVAADVTYASAASAKTLEVNASVESTTLVDGATLSLGYANADILSAKGSITAGALIKF